MFRITGITVGALIGALSISVGVQAQAGRGRGAPPPPATAQPARGAIRTGPDPREATARRICGQCHTFEFVTAVKRTKPQWEQTVENMVGRGARGTNAELSAIIDYLTEAHVLAVSVPRGGSGPDDRPMVDPKASEAARPLYSASCLACHGADARGTGQGPNLVRSLVVLKDRYGDKLGPYLRASHPPVAVAGRGAKPGPTTPTAFEALTGRDVTLLAHYLRDRVNDTLRGAPMFKPGNVLTGDPRAGAAYFQGEGQCTQCHSPTGDLAGVGRRLEPVAIQQRFLFPHTVRRPDAKVVTVTVTTESGETLNGTLERMDDFHVSLRDAGGNYRTVARTPRVQVVKQDPFAAHVALLSRITDKNMHDVVAYLESLK